MVQMWCGIERTRCNGMFSQIVTFVLTTQTITVVRDNLNTLCLTELHQSVKVICITQNRGREHSTSSTRHLLEHLIHVPVQVLPVDVNEHWFQTSLNNRCNGGVKTTRTDDDLITIFPSKVFLECMRSSPSLLMTQSSP